MIPPLKTWPQASPAPHACQDFLQEKKNSSMMQQFQHKNHKKKLYYEDILCQHNKYWIQNSQFILAIYDECETIFLLFK